MPLRLCHLLLLIPLTIISISYDLSIIPDEIQSPSLYLNILLFYVGMLGVYAYVFRKKLYNPMIWRGVFILSFFLHLSDTFGHLMQGEWVFTDSIMTIQVIALLCLYAYYYFLLWLYSFESNDIWRT